MSKTYKKTNSIKRKFNVYNNFLELSNCAEPFLKGMDFCGNHDDIIAFDECLDCGLYENIKLVETLKLAINVEFVKHVTIAKEIFSSDFERKQLGIQALMNYDYEFWLKHVKVFYFSILSDKYLCNLLIPLGIDLESIENVFELLIQLDEYIFERKNDNKNEWN